MLRGEAQVNPESSDFLKKYVLLSAMSPFSKKLMEDKQIKTKPGKESTTV